MCHKEYFEVELANMKYHFESQKKMEHEAFEYNKNRIREEYENKKKNLQKEYETKKYNLGLIMKLCRVSPASEEITISDIVTELERKNPGNIYKYKKKHIETIVYEWYQFTFDKRPNQRLEKIDGHACVVGCYSKDYKTAIIEIVKSCIQEEDSILVNKKDGLGDDLVKQ
jgi:hypothetical protein